MVDSSYPSVSQLTRRRLLTGGSRVAAAAAASALMPPNVRRLLAEAPSRSGSLRDIKHIVMLMQENRSFDHYFGTLAGVWDLTIHPHSNWAGANLSSISRTQSILRDTCFPFIWTPERAARRQFLHQSRLGSSHEAWNGGKMNQWLPAHRRADGPNGPYRMGYYSREDFLFSSPWPKRLLFATLITVLSWGRPGETACTG